MILFLMFTFFYDFIFDVLLNLCRFLDMIGCFKVFYAISCDILVIFDDFFFIDLMFI